jgi:sulfhydrogenase subunit alpha
MSHGDGTRTIKIDYLARVEGEGALYVRLKNDVLQDVKLTIFEPPRFFEGFLRGRSFAEAPDITARICGICPVAYMMSAAHAMERAFGVQVGGQLRELRRLLYCGEWIESHVLHMFMLHAPDFLGYDDAIQIARDHRELVEKVLRLKKLGNALMILIGGREIHPINIKVGGFYKSPLPRDLLALREELEWAREFAQEALSFVAALSFPDFEQDYQFVSLRHPAEYPLNEGRLVSSRGLDIDVADFEVHFEEQQLAHSNALHSVMRDGSTYVVGPLARYNLNYDKLPASVQQAAADAGLGASCHNPFKSIIVRGVEVLYALEEAIRIIDGYQRPPDPALPVVASEGAGMACTEAPRGILYHRYQLAADGAITDAKIVPPTAQNQKAIEQDLWRLIPAQLHLPPEQLALQCELAIRNYDPCISCATHFLKLTMERC